MIGYYAHSHGSGHCNYANIFAKVFGSALTVFTDREYAFGPDVAVVNLENENPDGNEYHREHFPEPRALHYAPVNITKITRRNALILKNVLARKISLLIIDVSVEVAMLARVSSIAYAYVRLLGDRDDIPHLNAYEGASFLLAYFPKELESPSTPSWICDKTVYLGFLSKHMLNMEPSEAPVISNTGNRPIVLHLKGFGGNRAFDYENLNDDYDIYAIGPEHKTQEGHAVKPLGIVKCTKAYIKTADVIIAACGSNTTSEILHLGKSFLAVPQKRHYQEQERMAESLHRLGWAVDYSKYANLTDAVSAVRRIHSSNLPVVSFKDLIDFRRHLLAMQFRADRFLMELGGNTCETVKRNQSGHTIELPELSVL